MSVKVLVFGTKGAADIALEQIDRVYFDLLAVAGETVETDENGRRFTASVNAVTGEASGRRTYSYHDGGPEPLEDGRWWIYSMTGQHPEWDGWRDRIASGVDLGTEQELGEDFEIKDVSTRTENWQDNLPAIGDVKEFGGVRYKSLVNQNGSTPSKNPAAWELESPPAAK